MRKCSGKILAAVLTGFALASAVSAGTLAAQEGNRPAMGDIRRIQAYTDETVYGTGLVKVEVTYNNGVSLTGINADSYILEDRGTLSPDYGKVKIAKAVVDGQVVTLTMDKGTAAAENNALIYTGESAQGSRVRNAFGVYCTGAWYRDENGAIHYGSGDADKGYLANTTGMGYQARACLELKLRHAWEEPSAAVCLAGEADGRYKDGGPWARTIDLQFGENGFRSFEQASDDTSRKYGGTGLGLAISDRLVRMMGGHIALESEENKGSDFSFTLLQTVGKRPVEEDDKLTEGALAGLEGARILLVEDNELNLEIARTILEMQKCQVETALNGQEGVERFCESSEGYYDLILMDIRMPVMDGLEAAKLIRASGRTDARTVPIVAMSANAFEEDVKKSLESGMNAHLAKPFQMEDLIRTMRRIIGRENRVGKNGPGETEAE